MLKEYCRECDVFNEDDFINEENLVPEEVENEFEEIDQSLVINFELVKFKENNKNENKENENINSNKEIFYLLFNFSQGEISNYYHCVKIFKEKAKIILKSFFILIIYLFISKNLSHILI